MPELSRAEALAQSIIRTAALHGLPTVALITDMNQPLGYAAGNWLEVREVLQALQGHGPEDLMQVTYALGVQMLLLAGFKGSTREAVSLLQSTIASGMALTRFQQLVRAQGGDVLSLREQGSCAAARIQQHLRAGRNGFVTGIDALKIGEAVVRLGGGRKALGDQIDPAVGVLLGKKNSDQVSKGEILAVIHANQTSAAREALEMVRDAFTIEAAPVPKGKSILRIIKN